MIKGVIFDMDGLMFDTERIWTTLWAPSTEKLGLPAPCEEFVSGARGLAGENMLRHLRKFYPQCDPNVLLAAVRAEGKTALANGAPAKPGLFALLDYLEEQNIPRSVASSSSHETIERYLRISGADRYFTDTVCGDDASASKPAPAIFLVAAQRLGLPASDCLVLEDSFNGVRAGHASGAVTVMVPDLQQPTEEILSLCDACCKDLNEVLDRMRNGGETPFPRKKHC